MDKGTAINPGRTVVLTPPEGDGVSLAEAALGHLVVQLTAERDALKGELEIEHEQWRKAHAEAGEENLGTAAARIELADAWKAAGAAVHARGLGVSLAEVVGAQRRERDEARAEAERLRESVLRVLAGIQDMSEKASLERTSTFQSSMHNKERVLDWIAGQAKGARAALTQPAPEDAWGAIKKLAREVELLRVALRNLMNQCVLSAGPTGSDMTCIICDAVQPNGYDGPGVDPEPPHDPDCEYVAARAALTQHAPGESGDPRCPTCGSLCPLVVGGHYACTKPVPHAHSPKEVMDALKAMLPVAPGVAEAPLASPSEGAPKG